MNTSLRIAVADDEPDMQAYYRKCLPRLGHLVVAVAGNGLELVEQCRTTRPDLVLTDIKMPDLDGIDAAVRIYQQRPIPVILVSAFHDAALVRRAEVDHIMAYLVKPIKQADLETAIAVAVRRFEQFEELRGEASDLRQALADRRMVERAKSHLMKQAGFDELEAFRHLQQLAREESRKLIEVAQKILNAEKALPPPERG